MARRPRSRTPSERDGRGMRWILLLGTEDAFCTTSPPLHHCFCTVRITTHLASGLPFISSRAAARWEQRCRNGKPLG